MEDESIEAVKRIKQLENQNAKFKKLLTATESLNNKDSDKVEQLKNEALNLAQIIDVLENKKEELKKELQKTFTGEQGEVTRNLQQLEFEHLELKHKLDKVLDDIKEENLEIERLVREDIELKKALNALEKEKGLLLGQLNSIEKHDSNSKESVELQEKISEIEEKKSSIMKLLMAKDMKDIQSEDNVLGNLRQVETVYKEYVQTLNDEVTKFEIKNENLANYVKNTNIPNQIEINEAVMKSSESISKNLDKVKSKLSSNEILKENQISNISLKIKKLEEEKQTLYQELKSSLESSCIELQNLKQKISDSEMRRLVEEIETQKNDLLENLKTLNEEKSLIKVISEKSDIDQFPEVPNHEIDANVKSQPSTSNNEKLNLKEKIEKLQEKIKQVRMFNTESVQERQLQTQSELHNTFMREHSSNDIVDGYNLDDATNQLCSNENQRLQQRIVELEMENLKIKKDLEDFMRDNCREMKTTLKDKIDELEKKDL